MQEIKLKKFNPRCIEQTRKDPQQGPSTIVMIGSKRTGKTTLIEDIVYYFRKIPTGIIVTGSQSSAQRFSKWFPMICIYDSMNNTVINKIETIVNNQKKLNEKKVDYDYDCLMIFDDCAYDKKFAKTEIFREIFYNGRHLRIMLLYTTQYVRSIPPDIRNNIDYCFVGREPSVLERKKLYQELFGIIPNFPAFCKVMDITTDKYGVLVLDKTSVSNNISDNIYYYKAKFPTRKYKACSKKLWDIHNKYYKNSHEENSKKTTNETKQKVLKTSLSPNSNHSTNIKVKKTTTTTKTNTKTKTKKNTNKKKQ